MLGCATCWSDCRMRSRWRTMKRCCRGTAYESYHVKPGPIPGWVMPRRSWDVLCCTAKYAKHVIDSGHFLGVSPLEN